MSLLRDGVFRQTPKEHKKEYPDGFNGTEIIVHNLHSRVDVRVEDAVGAEIDCTVIHNDLLQFTVSFVEQGPCAVYYRVR